MRRFGWLITGPLLLALVAFAIANRRDVILSFDPFSLEAPAIALQTSLYAIVFAALFLGFIVGAIASWGFRTRNELRRAARKRQEIKATEAPDPLAGVPAIAGAKIDAPPSGILHPPPGLLAPRD